MRLRRLPRPMKAALTRVARPRLGLFALLFVFFAGAALGGGYSALAGDLSPDPGAVPAVSSSDSTSTVDESTTSTTTADTTTVEVSTEVTPTTTEESISGDGSGSTTDAPAGPPPSDG